MLNFLKKRFAVFTAFIYFSAVLVGCSSTRFIVKDYSAYVGNLFSYYLSVDDDFDEGYGEDNDNEPGNTDNSSCGDLIEAEKYVGLVNIGSISSMRQKRFSVIMRMRKEAVKDFSSTAKETVSKYIVILTILRLT